MEKRTDTYDQVKHLIEKSLISRLPEGVSDLSSVLGVDGMISALSSDIEKVISCRIQIRTCTKCGSVFATMNPRQFFCSKECAKTYGKSCFKSKLETDEALSCYNKAYKAMAARCIRGRISREELDIWRINAKGLLEELRQGNIEFSEFHKKVTIGIRRWEHFEEAC